MVTGPKVGIFVYARVEHVLQRIAGSGSGEGHQKGNLARRYEAGPSRDSSEGRSMHDTPFAAKPDS